MSRAETQLALITAAEQHFVHPTPPEHDADERDSLMYQYQVARDAALFFDKARKKLLEELIEAHESEIDEALAIVVKSGDGIPSMLVESGDIFNLHLKISAPPRTFDKSRLAQALNNKGLSPVQIKEVVNECTVAGTPRKTFEVHAKSRIDE